MTSEGHAYARFRRALGTGNPMLALAAATDLKVVSLEDALALTLLLAARDPERFDRAALRWHGRFCREAPAVALAEGLAVLGLLAALGRAERPAALNGLGAFFDARGDRELAAVVRRQFVEMQPGR